MEIVLADGHDLAVGLDRQRASGVEPAEVRDDAPVAAEGVVERAVGVIPGECEATAAVCGDAGGDDLAVGLDRDSERLVVLKREVRTCHSVAAERRVEGSSGGVPRDGKLAAAARGPPCDDDLPVGLNRDPSRRVVPGRQVRRYEAIAAEARVEVTGRAESRRRRHECRTRRGCHQDAKSPFHGWSSYVIGGTI